MLFAAYASTLGLGPVPGREHSADEARQIAATAAVASTHKLDTFRDDSTFLGLPLIAAVAWEAGDETAAQLVIAALLALAGACAYLLARRAVPDPWALGASLAVGLSAPLVAQGTTLLPHVAAAGLLALAALGAVRVVEHPSRLRMFACFVPLAVVPWLGFQFCVAGLVLAWWTVRGLRRRNRGLLALFGVETIGFSLAVQIGLNEALFGGPAPNSGDAPGTSVTGADSAVEYAERVWRAAALFVDREIGLLRWAPVLLLAFAGALIVYRAGRERLALAIPGLTEEHGVVRLCAAAIGAQLLVAVFLVPAIEGDWFPARDLVPVLPLAVPLVGVGLRQWPRAGTLLALLGLAASVWVWIALRSDDFASRPDAPFGPLTDALPRFVTTTDRWIFTAAAAVIVAVLVARQELAIRRPGRE